jgi:hypothetical protein
VLALGLFPVLGYRKVWAKLVAALDGWVAAGSVGQGAAGPAALGRLRQDPIMTRQPCAR